MQITITAHDGPENSVRVFINPTLPSRVVYLSYRADRLDASDRTETLHIRLGTVVLRTPYAYKIVVLKYEGERSALSPVIANAEEMAAWMQLQDDEEREAAFRLGRTKIFIGKKARKMTIYAPVGYEVTTDEHKFWHGM